MIINSFIPLNQNSRVRLDALNTLKYTLLFDYCVPELKESEDFICSLMINCHKCCRSLFNESPEEPAVYNFFGRVNNLLQFPLCFLNNESIPKDLEDKVSNPTVSFHTMILQHCILSSYHAILTELQHNQTVSSYTVTNKIKDTGFFALYKNGHISINENKEILNYPNKNSIPKNSSKASDFNKTVKTHIEKMPSFFNLFITNSNSEKTPPQYWLQFSSLLHKINHIPASDFNVLCATKSYKLNNMLKKIEILTNKMEPPINTDKRNSNIIAPISNPVDKLYDYYLTERLFNFNLFYSLLKNIKIIEEKTSYRLCQDETISILNHCTKLPNVFSRQYFLKYAFDHILAMPDSYNDFWHTQDIEKSHIVMYSTRKVPKHFQFAEWINQYKLFMNYMSQFVIPVYEWCFLNMLLTAIENKYPCKSHNFHLEKALNFLAKYIYEHYQEILCPISISDSMDIVCIASKHKNVDVLECLPQESILKIMESFFCPHDNYELNLKLLNPNFFKKSKDYRVENNESRIRKFYIDLIRYTHLE